MVGVRRRRGQAFETMMLVISVIVAVAILGVLLGFLGNISFGATGAKDTMKSLVSKIQQSGGGSEVSKRADFAEALRLKPDDIIGETPILSSNVKFWCAESEFCGGGTNAAMDVKNDQITVKTKASGAIVVCKAYKGTNAKYYNICIGSSDDPNAVADFCDGKCK